MSLPMTPAPPPPTGSERGLSASGCCRHCSPEQPKHAEASPRHIQTLLGAQAQEARTNTFDICHLDRRVTTTATSEGLLALPSSPLLIRFPPEDVTASAGLCRTHAATEDPGSRDVQNTPAPARRAPE